MVGRVGNGDQALTTILSRQSAALRAEVTRHTTEMTTGRHTDMGAAVDGDFSALAAIDHSLARLKGYAANTSEAALFTDAMQTALGVIADGATELASNILRSADLVSATSMDAVATDAIRTFETSIAALNTRFSERALFSGVSAETQPLPDPGTILSAIEAAITSAGASTVGDVQSAIADWFDDPLGYQALYAGGGPRADVPVAAGETADLSVTARDPAIKDTLRGLATMALLGRGLMAGQVEARSDLAKAAGEDLLTGSESRSHLMARVGTVQAQIAAAQTRNTAEESALSITRAGIISADPYDAATRLEDLQTRIEALYLVTARVSRLSLADYL